MGIRARGTRGRDYPWGEESPEHGVLRANVWQGRFPADDTGTDGYRGTSRPPAILRTATASTTWQETCGSGRATGTVPTPTCARPAVAGDRPARTERGDWIPASPPFRSASFGAAPISAAPRTARATVRRRAPIRARRELLAHRLPLRRRRALITAGTERVRGRAPGHDVSATARSVEVPQGLAHLPKGERGDLNPHGCLAHRILNPARLPVPTLSLGFLIPATRCGLKGFRFHRVPHSTSPTICGHVVRRCDRAHLRHPRRGSLSVSVEISATLWPRWLTLIPSSRWTAPSSTVRRLHRRQGRHDPTPHSRAERWLTRCEPAGGLRWTDAASDRGGMLPLSFEIEAATLARRCRSSARRRRARSMRRCASSRRCAPGRVAARPSGYGGRVFDPDTRWARQVPTALGPRSPRDGSTEFAAPDHGRST